MFDSPAPSRDNIPPLTVCAIAACVLIFLGLQTLGERPLYADTAKFGLYHDSAIWEGKPWAILTHAFVHREIWHLFFNLYWLWILGGNIERDIGSLRWILFVLAAAWISSAAQLAAGGLGIGFSGVGYAFFGFAWVAREKLRETRPIVNEGTVNLFLIWFVAAIIFTRFGWLNVGNEAHFGGLIFGCAVGWFYARRNHAWLGAVATIILLAASFFPLFYAPLSADWTALQAEKARDAKNYDQAVYWFKRTLAQGSDEKWVWSNLAFIYSETGNEKEARQAIAELAKLGALNESSAEESDTE